MGHNREYLRKLLEAEATSVLAKGGLAVSVRDYRDGFAVQVVGPTHEESHAVGMDELAGGEKEPAEEVRKVLDRLRARLARTFPALRED